MTDVAQSILDALVRIETKLDSYLERQPDTIDLMGAMAKGIATAQGYDRPAPEPGPDLIVTPDVEPMQPFNEIVEEVGDSTFERPEFWSQIGAEPPVDIFDAGPDGAGP